jgi:cytochrome b561
MSGFERWTNVGLTGVSSSRLGPRWAIVAATACLAMIFFAMVGFRSGGFRGALVAIGLVGLVLLFLRTWFILMARTRRYLVARPDWTDLTRLALFLAVYVAILAVGAVVGFTLIVVMGALDQIAKGA